MHKETIRLLCLNHELDWIFTCSFIHNLQLKWSVIHRFGTRVQTKSKWSCHGEFSGTKRTKKLNKLNKLNTIDWTAIKISGKYLVLLIKENQWTRHGGLFWFDIWHNYVNLQSNLATIFATVYWSRSTEFGVKTLRALFEFNVANRICGPLPTQPAKTSKLTRSKLFCLKWMTFHFLILFCSPSATSHFLVEAKVVCSLWLCSILNWEKVYVCVCGVPIRCSFV